MNTAHAEYGTAVITHGFPNLTYKNTQSIKSDPEITVYHDRVGVTGNTNLALIAATGVIVAVAATGAVVFMRKRKKK
jgi:LPXTG-motif cell wall-anchored protein